MHRRLLPLSAIALAACNSITGADDLTVRGAGGAGGQTTLVTGGAGGQGTGGTGSTAPPPPALVPAEGVTISQVALYQGPKHPLFGGEPSPAGIQVPVVAGREALIRVFVTTEGGYDGSPVTARLHLGSGDPLEVVGPVSTGDEASLGSTVNFTIPGERMVPGADYRVELLMPPDHATGDNTAARHPESGTLPLGAVDNGPSLEVVIVPVKYDADGSGRLPDTSPAQIQGYRDALYAVYPAAKVNLTVRAPFSWPYTVFSFGTGWGGLLDAISDLRAQDGAADSVYYYGAFAPAPSFDDYCWSSCTTGLGNVGSADDPYSHAAIGLGYTGADAFATAIHEIGHNQGRTHAPCGGASGVDPGFPYAGAGVGVWGYDLVKKALISPGAGKDLMGYCDPYWISDYTFKGIFEEMKAVSGAKIVIPPDLLHATWEKARIEPDGSLTLLSPVVLPSPPRGADKSLAVKTAAGTVMVTGHFRAYDHLPGGVVLWKQGAEPALAVALP